MAEYVVDAAMAIAWAAIDELDERNLRILDEVQRSGMVVPTIWPLEIANACLSMTRQGRLPAGSMALLLTDLHDLPYRVDALTTHQSYGTTLGLAVKHGLSVYDAAYLELAKRLGAPLATLDKQLAAAARAEFVPVHGVLADA